MKAFSFASLTAAASQRRASMSLSLLGEWERRELMCERICPFTIYLRVTKLSYVLTSPLPVLDLNRTQIAFIRDILSYLVRSPVFLGCGHSQYPSAGKASPIA